ncbi:hypothetical protein HUS13_02720 [Pseudomonas aeruginosa]|uniref:hypothetical protein n=1 Tax=Pseudomonas aeruginosa TaxID=287 RepID=UPI001923CFAE|nr:hypothetical protein [Pseudomonas aeruginosa]QQW13548.1 hypothetical protein HUS13_02720 [Pseudomonas aeruginosa]
MERYHSTAGDPPRRDADVKRQEAQELDELVQQFLGRRRADRESRVQDARAAGHFRHQPMKTPVYNGALAENSSLKAKPAAPRRKQRPSPNAHQRPCRLCSRLLA